MTAPAAAGTAYSRLLLQARLRGLAAGRAEILRINEGLRLAAEQLRRQMASPDPLTAERATAIRQEILATLRTLEDHLAASGSRLVPLTVNGILDLHKEALPRILADAGQAVPTGLTARLDALNTRVLSVIAARRGGTAATFRTLVHRHIEDAAPALDRLLTAGISQGTSVDRLGKAVEQLLQGHEPDDAEFARTGLGGLRSIGADARMIARSETMNALREANAYAQVEGGVVAATKWQLNGAHPEEDECDIYAEYDGWKFGKGFYPPDRWPLAPHPNCGCYQGEVKFRPADQWGTSAPRSATIEPDLDELVNREGWSEADRAAARRRLENGLSLPSRAT